MVLNDAGKIVADEWVKTDVIRREIELDAWGVTPNHFHGIIVIVDGGRPTNEKISAISQIQTLRHRMVRKDSGALMAGFKSTITKRINEMRNTPGMKLWPRNYYEHIIPDEGELDREIQS